MTQLGHWTFEVLIGHYTKSDQTYWLLFYIKNLYKQCIIFTQELVKREGGFF